MAWLERYLTVVWHVVVLLVIGSVFNVAVAFLSLYAKEIQLIVPLLTGYGIYKFLQGSKNESVSGATEQGRE